MANTKLVTTSFSVDTGKQMIQEIGDGVPYYVFAAKHTPYLNNSDQTITIPTESVQAGTIQVYNDMIFGKKVLDDDVCPLIVRNDWVANSVYSMYDDTNGSLFTDPFYVSVNAGSYTNIYKCLNNNSNTYSLVEPSGFDDKPFQTMQDGYVWKYMYTANDTITKAFATNDYMPLVPNTSVQANAISGAIDVINVDDPGGGYNNYLTDSFGTSADIKIGGNPYLYGLGAAASSIDGFYNGCIILMTSGDAKNEYKIIGNYYVSGGQKVIVLNDTFSNNVLPTDSFEIYPYVYVFDTGASLNTNCIARAIINPVGNSVSYVDVLQAGSGYRSAITQIIQDPSVPTTSNSSLRPIIPPPGGHGYDPLKELGATEIGISVQFIENEIPFSTNNDYRTIGLLRNPQFTNVDIKIDTTTQVGAFLTGETIYQYNPVYLNGTVSVNSSPTVTGSNTQFSQGLAVGDQILITNGTSNFFANVSNIANDTVLTLSSNVSFVDGSSQMIYMRNPNNIGVFFSNSFSYINVTKAYPFDISKSNYLIGGNSSATVQIDLTANSDLQVTIQGRSAENFEKFNQLTTLSGLIGSGSPFQQDEELFQAALVPQANATAYLHSYVSANGGPYDTLLVTNVKNIFQDVYSSESDGQIQGLTSGNHFVLYNKYDGDLIKDSGDIIYLENLSPISRSNTKTETIKLILSY